MFIIDKNKSIKDILLPNICNNLKVYHNKLRSDRIEKFSKNLLDHQNIFIKLNVSFGQIKN